MGFKSSEGIDDDRLELRVAHRMHRGWWILVAIVLVIASGIIQMLLTNKNLEWNVVREYLFNPRILRGALMTLRLTALAMIFGILLGILAAVMRLSPVKVLSTVAWAYTSFFRGTPLLVQLIFWYNIAALFPRVYVGLPLGGPIFWSGDTNVVVTPFLAVILGLSLNEGAYMSEIVRGGILSVDAGQTEAGAALGMTRPRIMRRIILPQAMRVIIPPTGNQLIGMLKSTALVSVTSIAELLYTSQQIYNQNFKTIPLLIVASLWYLVMMSVLTTIQYYIERHFARGGTRSLPQTPIQKFKLNFSKFLSRVSSSQGRAQHD